MHAVHCHSSTFSSEDVNEEDKDPLVVASFRSGKRASLGADEVEEDAEEDAEEEDEEDLDEEEEDEESMLSKLLLFRRSCRYVHEGGTESSPYLIYL